MEKNEKVENPAPNPSKKTLVLLSVAAGVFFVGFLVLGYFYYSKIGQYKTVVAEKERLSAQIAEKEQLSTQLEEKTKELDVAKASIPDTKPLEKQIADYQSKIAKAQAYNAFFKYLNSVIEIHNGFTGWTDAEYQIARGLAQKTNNSSFLAVVDNAWTNQAQPVTDRLISVWKAIATGIETALK